MKFEFAPRNAGKDIAIALAFVIFVWTMVKNIRVPFLSLIDLGFHELGHLLTYPLPDLFTAIAGSFVQVAVPLGLAVYFLVRLGDDAAMALLLGWAGTSAADAARYIADAPYERLPLLGNGEHDWAYTLYELDLMEQAGVIAAAVYGIGWIFVAVGLGALARPYVQRYVLND